MLLFNHQLGTGAIEVGDVITDRLLPPNMQAIELVIA